jgi:hypothetical protein
VAVTFAWRNRQDRYDLFYSCFGKDSPGAGAKGVTNVDAQPHRLPVEPTRMVETH